MNTFESDLTQTYPLHYLMFKMKLYYVAFVAVRVNSLRRVITSLNNGIAGSAIF